MMEMSKKSEEFLKQLIESLEDVKKGRIKDIPNE